MRVLFTMLLGLWVSVSWSGSLFPDTWDGDFRSATETFLPVGTDYRLLKSQCYQESRLDPLAVSPVGAYGLCQFMPGTAKDVGKALNARPDEFWLPEVSIRASGYYMAKLHRVWKAKRPAMDRYMLALASYNAGAGHLINAQKHCGGASLYVDIIPCLPSITGRHSVETTNYVQYIVYRWYPRMLYD